MPKEFNKVQYLRDIWLYPARNSLLPEGFFSGNLEESIKLRKAFLG